ncbi:inositol oxygenase [Neocloeon triangulifer]|uniref:inositol oxygenase n=1 Tax=Neocloeon triangulifer TaxID=2078957 RepID=UPI00286F2793|nr:inositol oxygenase [Neocloeon triangulifer]
MRVLQKVSVLDPSELLRPEIEFAAKEKSKFRDYTVAPDNVHMERVFQTYSLMHNHQTVDFVKSKIEKWTKFNTFKGEILETLDTLDNLIDESDPDVDIPNSVHAYQTAEQLRRDYPDLDWLHLTGLIHDLGKVMAFYEEPQWAVVGDTFPVGCDWGESIVYRHETFKDNPDGNNPKLNTKIGMYSENCGLDKIMMSWGHDEYMYRVLQHNKSKLPEEALYMIRYHSFYPWHVGGDYTHLCNKKDMEMLKWVQLFNKYDLYTKSAKVPDVKSIKPYYQSLVDKYMPGVLEW